MTRMVDLQCPTCERELLDQFLADDAQVKCRCGDFMEQIWWKRRTQRSTCWDEKDAVVVFKRPDGTFSFPARNDKPCPKDWERITARSDREVAQIEKMTNTLNQDRWFDKGAGRGFDDYDRQGKLTH